MKKKKYLTVAIYCACAVFILITVGLGLKTLLTKNGIEKMKGTQKVKREYYIPDLVGVSSLYEDLPITEQFLTVNPYSRPGLALSQAPQYIVVHYTANPGSTGWDNRNYFENLKDTQLTYASAQFVIGMDGQIIQCVPCNEMSYCSNSYNEFCISIEMCHPDETGAFSDETYNSCVYLVAHLMNYYHLDQDRLIRHYDVTGKNCPKYFVENEDKWNTFKDYVQKYREEFYEKDEEIYNQKVQESGVEVKEPIESVNIFSE